MSRFVDRPAFDDAKCLVRRKYEVHHSMSVPDPEKSCAGETEAGALIDSKTLLV